MNEQKELFGFSDITPWAKKGVKKIITRDRLEEVQRLLESGKSRGAAEIFRDIHERLEEFNRKIKV